MMNLTDASYWENFWGGQFPEIIMNKEGCELHPLLSQYLPQATQSNPVELIEIGCYPGWFLYYFAKEFGYRVSGVDFLPEAGQIPAKLASVGVDAQVCVADFFTFKPDHQYDIVFSKGFVEHFANWQEVLQKLLDLLKPGGSLVIDFPNFRYGQYWLRWLIDPHFAAGHCLEVMDPQMWGEALTERGLEIHYCGYFKTFEIWIAGSSPAARGSGRKLPRALFGCLYAIHKFIAWTGIEFPNRFFSPYAVIIASKPA
jgi:SAM-dependent methyltransferase